MPVPAEVAASPVWAAASPSVRAVVDALDVELATRPGALNGYLQTSRSALADHVAAARLVAPALRVARRLGLLRRGPGGWRLTFRPGPNGEAPSNEWITVSAGAADAFTSRLAAAERPIEV
jgi:hypothetical protein